MIEKLVQIYLTAWQWLGQYVGGVIGHFVGNPVTLPNGYWTDFLFLGFTDLTSYLTFIVNMLIFVWVHLMLIKGFKWCIRFFGGVGRVF